MKKIVVFLSIIALSFGIINFVKADGGVNNPVANKIFQGFVDYYKKLDNKEKIEKYNFLLGYVNRLSQRFTDSSRLNLLSAMKLLIEEEISDLESFNSY